MKGWIVIVALLILAAAAEDAENTWLRYEKILHSEANP